MSTVFRANTWTCSHKYVAKISSYKKKQKYKQTHSGGYFYVTV